MLYGTVTEFCTPQEVRISPSLAVTRYIFCLLLDSVRSCLPAHGQYAPLRSLAAADQMHVAGRYEYLWEDGVRYKRPTKLPAPEYVDALMNWAQNLLDNEEIFPNKIGTHWSPLGVVRLTEHVF